MSLIPVAFYRAFAVEGEYGVFPNTGGDFVRVTFQIMGGEYDGQQVQWTGHFTEKTAQRTIESLQYCGCTFPDNDITNLDGLGSQEVSIDVQHEDYTDKNGNLRTMPRVAWVNQPGGVKQEHQMNPAQKASFRDRMKGQLIGMKSGQQQPIQRQAAPAQKPAQQQQQRRGPQQRQAPPQQQHAQPQGQFGDDDIPF